MQSKLQELTEKLYNEGVVKANEEALQIIDKAKKDAEEIINKAKEKADSIIEDANKKSADIAKNTKSELKLSAKQAMNALKQEITEMLTSGVIGKSVNESVKETDFVKSIIEIAVKNWNPKGEAAIDLVVLLPESNKKAFDGFVETKLKKLVDGGIVVNFDNKLKNGFKIGPADGSYIISFTEEDFDNFFKAYLRPRTAQLLYGEE
ncbi:MAG: hypothetical protein JXB49_03145 [Bacteroidales bacterium]|nr:hypothetical protein [Bacteroidales bacterium]